MVDPADFFVVLVRRGLWRSVASQLTMLCHTAGREADIAHDLP